MVDKRDGPLRAVQLKKNKKIKRLNNSIDKKPFIKVSESIFTSKIRYGLQLLGKVKLDTSDSQQIELLNIQKGKKSFYMKQT